MHLRGRLNENQGTNKACNSKLSQTNTKMWEVPMYKIWILEKIFFRVL